MSGVEKANKIQANRDRLLELPNSIIDIILSYLPSPKEIVKTKILSKRWRERPCNLPTVYFDEVYGTKLGIKSTFEHNVDRIIKSLHQNQVSISRFELNIRASGSDADLIVDSWMKMAIDNSVEEIYLWNDGEGSLRFPPSILAAKSLKSLKILGLWFPDELFGIPASLSCLKRLDLCFVYVKDDMLNHIISQSPKLEELLLRLHEGAGKLQLTNLHYLKYVYVDQLTRRTTYEVEAPSLERLRLKIYPFWHFQLTAMENLRSLEITSSFSPILESFLCEVIPRLPVLETLLLDSWLKKLEIRSRSIQVIILELWRSPEEVKIDAPNLCRLYYESSMPLKDFGARRSPGRWEAYIRHDNRAPSRSPWDPPPPQSNCGRYRSQRYLYPDLIRSPWFVKLRETLSKPSPFQFFYIKCGSPYFEGEEMGLEDFEDANLLYRVAELDHLKLDVGASCPSSFSAVVASLFWNCRPKFLSLRSTRTNAEHIEFFCKELKATPSCCEGGGGFKCWRHYLKDVREISYREIEGVVEPRHSSGYYADYGQQALEDAHICLKLVWGWD